MQSRKPVKKAFVLVHPCYDLYLPEQNRQPTGIFEIKSSEYARIVKKTLEKSNLPVYVLYDSEPEQIKKMIGTVRVNFIKTREESPEPVMQWQKFCANLKKRGVKHVLLGGSSLFFTDSPFKRIEPEKRSEARGCVVGALRNLRKAGFKVRLVPAMCWPHKGYEKQGFKHLRERF